MTTVSPILRSGYPPVILRSDGEIKINQSVDNIILRTEEVRVDNQLGANILKTRSDVHVKITQSSLILRSSDVGSHNHDLRYYTQAITDTLLSAKVAIEDIVNNLTTDESDKPLSAAQGVVLKGLIDQINTLLTSNDVSLDELQEIVNYIKENRADIDSLGISSIIGLQAALDAKVPNSRTLTINGVTYDLSANRSFTIPTATPGGSEGSVQINKNGALYGEDNFSYDDKTKEITLYSSLGSEKVTTPTLGSGFTSDATYYKKSANGTGTLSSSVNAKIGEQYLLCFDVENLTVGTFTVSLGSVTIATISANGQYKYKVRANSTTGLIFTPTNTSRFDIKKSTLSLKKLTGGNQNINGKGFYNDVVKISLDGNNYTPGTIDHLTLENPTGAYTHISYKFGSTVKSAISGHSSGVINLYTTSSNGVVINNGGVIGSQSPIGYLTSVGIIYNGYGVFSGKVSAGNQSSSQPSMLNVWGSKSEKGAIIKTQNYVLGEHVYYVIDASGANACVLNPSETLPACSSFSGQTACEAQTILGCYFQVTLDCSSYNGDPDGCSNAGCTPATSPCSELSEYDCPNNSPCYWNSGSDPCDYFDETTCNDNSSNGCTPSYTDLSSYNGDETGCTENGGSYDTENNICNGPFEYCSGYVSYYFCDGGNYNNGNCDGGILGNCLGNSTCGNFTTQTPCDAQTGCMWTNALNVLLPNSSTFWQGNQTEGMGRDYRVFLRGTGTVNLGTQGDDKYHDNTTTKTLAVNKAYTFKFYGVYDDCDGFDESQCGTYSGCSPNYEYDENTMEYTFINCSGQYLKYRHWFGAKMDVI